MEKSFHLFHSAFIFFYIENLLYLSQKMNFLIILSTQNLRNHFVNLKPSFNLREVIKRDNNDVFNISCFSVNLFFGEIPTEFFMSTLP